MNKILASLIFFTRLPFGKFVIVPSETFRKAVDCWPFVGWLTGATMAGTLWLASHCLPMMVAVIMAFLLRILITGAMHEDGLADFCDGFGGGTSRERILTIMKDSHIGTYGVLGLIIYSAIWCSLVSALPINLACSVLISGDAWCKFTSSQIINVLPYARNQEESKARVVYEKMDKLSLLLALVAGILPLVLFIKPLYWSATLAPIIVTILMILLMRRRINGYTGDCCGASFLICELSYLLTIYSIFYLLP